MTRPLRFAVRTSHPWSPPGWIWVLVYDDVEQLQRAAMRYNPAGEGLDEAAACFQGGDFSVHTDDDGRVDRPAGRYAGVLRMTREQGVATLAHECTHAAIAIYGRQHAVVVDLMGSMDDEEALCYIVGDLVGSAVRQLYAHGVWPA